VRDPGQHERGSADDEEEKRPVGHRGHHARRTFADRRFLGNGPCDLFPAL
jgi:hypothetical protein